METCTNCGATLRPGAKFCTICGTRLNAAAGSNQSWGWRAPESNDVAQDTTVIEAVPASAPQQPTSIAGTADQRDADRWRAAYGSPAAPADDPASRFISALAQDPKPVVDDTPAVEPEEPVSPNPAATWVTPPPEAFRTGRLATWNSGSSSHDDDGWKAPDTWNTVTTTSAGTESGREPSTPAASETAEPEVDTPTVPRSITSADVQGDDEGVAERMPLDTAGAREDEATAHTYASDSPDASSAPTPAIDPNDARARAISLIDELQRMVRLMPGGDMPDMGAAAMTLTEASLGVSDFADVRAAITELQEDPRDIQALSNLARMADKIELLLDEHQVVSASIETALQEMSGQQ